MPTMCRTFVSAGRTRPAASKRKATPGTSTRSSQPLRMAGGLLHHVGYTNVKTVGGLDERGVLDRVIGSSSGCSVW